MKNTSFSEEERAAMKERARELKAEANKESGEKALLAKIAEMSGSDRTIAEELHKIIMETAPTLTPKTWYGFPAYANSEGKVVCFFQPAEKFKTRYATLGFSDQAALDDGDMWSTSYAIIKLNSEEKKTVITLIKKAVH